MRTHAHCELMETAMNYLPLIKKTAGRYTGRGAEWDDLLVQGFCEAVDLILKCPEDKSLPVYMSNMLPGRIRDVSNRLRRQAAHDSLELLAESGIEPRQDSAHYSPQLLLAGIDLTCEERSLIDYLLEGYTQKEVAELLGCTQQNISYRVRKLQKKLQPLREQLYS